MYLRMIDSMTDMLSQTLQNVTGTATSDAKNYYILCGSGSCSDFTFNDVHISGGGEASSCNYKATGDFVCSP